MSYDRNFQHVIIVQEYVAGGSLKDRIYKKVVLLYCVGIHGVHVDQCNMIV